MLSVTITMESDPTVVSGSNRRYFRGVDLYRPIHRKTARIGFIFGLRLLFVGIVDSNEYIRKMFIISISFRRLSFLASSLLRVPLQTVKASHIVLCKGNP